MRESHLSNLSVDNEEKSIQALNCSSCSVSLQEATRFFSEEELLMNTLDLDLNNCEQIKWLSLNSQIENFSVHSIVLFILRQPSNGIIFSINFVVCFLEFFI